MINGKVTIVIVTKNGRKYLPELFESLKYQDYPKNLCDILVVDNDSNDSTVGYIQEKYSEVKVSFNPKNVGFASANNQGYVLATKNNSEFLVLLNQDTVVEKNWLKRLVKTAQNNNKAAVVQAKLLLHSEKELINSYGNKLQYLGFGYCDKYKQKNNLNFTDPIKIAYASGAACLIRISALDKVGGLFDDKLFMYHEDTDLGWRLNLAGYDIMLDPLSVVYHKYSYTKAKYKFYYMERNRWILMLQNYHFLTLCLLLPPLVLMELGMIFYSIRNGWFREKFKASWWLLWHWPSVLSCRLDVQFRIRKIKDREMMKLMASEIDFQEVKYPLLTYIVNPLMTVYYYLLRLVVWW